jgi:hypothetical protein
MNGKPIKLTLRNDLQLVTNIDNGRMRLIDPSGTLYGTDMLGYKQQQFLPKVTGVQSYRFRVHKAIHDNV